jgi:hypothetical protein
MYACVFSRCFCAARTKAKGTLSCTPLISGPQSRELLLLVSKIAAEKGVSTSCICAPGTEEGCRRLMYGSDYAKNGVDKEGHAKPISDGEDIGAALQDATSMILVGHDNPVEVSTLATFLKYIDKEKLRKVVLLSKMGVKNSGGGGFFSGGGNKALLQSEQSLAKLAQDNNLDFSIVRAGILKGGGPGMDEEGNTVHSFGLDRAFYNTILDVVEFKVAMAHDRFTLGANSISVVAGDPHSMPNMMTQMGTKTSFDPSLTDTNRIVAASAAVAALDMGPMEISVGTAEGRMVPTTEQWTKLIQTLQPKVLG